jgi:DNA (cytosine-5)-methyltransferase 1
MRTASFFTGAMGLDIGLERQGFETVVAIENDRHAQATIKANRPNVPILSDIFALNHEELLSFGPIDLVAGGPPCQSWSYAGNRKGLEDHRGLCIPRYLDIIEIIRPRLVVMENVLGFLTASIDGVKGAMLPYVTRRLNAIGYATSAKTANSADYGTPQCRHRIIIMGSLNGKAPCLVETHAKEDLFGLPQWRTLKDAIGDKPIGDGARYSPNRLRFFKMLKAGQTWRNLPKHLQAEAIKGAFYSGGGRTSYFRRLSWDKPAPTLTCSPTQNSTGLCHPDEDRPLNIAEYARIQQFPDDWIFCGPLSARYRQIGNAIPVGLGEAIGIALSKSTHPS